MIQIVLSDDQVQAVESASSAVELRDARGRLVGFISQPVDEAEMSEARRRLHSDGPWYSTQQVLDHLRSLEQE